MNIFLTLFAALAGVVGLLAERPLEVTAQMSESNSAHHRKRSITIENEDALREKYEDETSSPEDLIIHIEEHEFISSLNDLSMEELKECVYYIAHYRKEYLDNAYKLFGIVKKAFQAFGFLASGVEEISEQPKYPLEVQNLMEKVNFMDEELKKNLNKVKETDTAYIESISSSRNRTVEKFLNPYKTALESKSEAHCARHILNSLEALAMEKFATCDDQSKLIWEIARSETGKVQESIEEFTSAMKDHRQTYPADDRSSNCVNQILKNLMFAEEIHRDLVRIDAFWDTYKPYLRDDYMACFDRVLGLTQEEKDDLEEDVQRCIRKRPWKD